MIETKITAHKGFSLKYPENTLSAFRGAVDCGADRVELDVHSSRDGHLVVHHDYYLGSTDNGKGLIFEHDLSYLKSLDAGSWFSRGFSTEKIPLLEEVFDEVGTKAEYEIQLRGFTVEYLQVVLELVEKAGLARKVEFTSERVILLTALRQLCPTARIGLFVRPFPDWMSLGLGHEVTKSDIALANVTVAHCSLPILTPDFVENLHHSGVDIQASNCHIESEIREAYRLGVDSLSTDDLPLALSIRNQWDPAG